MILRQNESYSMQIWLAVAGLGGFIALLGFLSPQLRQSRSPMGGEDVSYSYEMPRVEPEEGPFDLSDREVSRQQRELEALIAKKKKAEVVAKAKATAQAKAAAQAQATAQAKAAAARRTQIQTISASDRYQRMKSSSAQGSETSYQPAYNYGYANAAAPALESGKKDEDEERLSRAQWLALLQSQPNSGNVNKLLKARSKGQIDDLSVLEIGRDLLKDSSDERRAAGFMIVDRWPSTATFEFLVKAKSEFGTDLQTELQKRIVSYSEAARLSFLGPILARSQDKVVVAAALEQVETAVENYRKYQTSGGNSAQTGGVATLGQLQIFVNTLNQVAKSGDPALAQLAQAVSTDIQALGPKKTQIAGTEGSEVSTRPSRY